MNDTRKTEDGPAMALRSGELVSPSVEPRAPDWHELKLAINNAIWMHAPASTTLGQAEDAACLAISHIAKCYNVSAERAVESANSRD